MLTIISERFMNFNEQNDEKIFEIIVDTADELPEADGIPGKILHQGSSALIAKEGRIAVLAGDGHWYVNGEEV